MFLIVVGDLKRLEMVCSRKDNYMRLILEMAGGHWGKRSYVIKEWDKSFGYSETLSFIKNFYKCIWSEENTKAFLGEIIDDVFCSDKAEENIMKIVRDGVFKCLLSECKEM